MVGATHVSTPHQYIYDSPEESLGSSQQTVSTITQIQQVTGGGTPTTTSSTTPTTPSTSDGGTQTPSAPVPTPTPTPTPPPTPPPSSPPSGGGGY